jgi:endonuclease/exonuclease/phosphatase family metal-dependent hydrolase
MFRTLSRNFSPSVRSLISHQRATSTFATHYGKVEPWKSGNEALYETTGNFSVVSFNMLAPIYKRLNGYDLHAKEQKRESQFLELWTTRAQKTKDFFEKEFFNSSDIIALQEFWMEKQYLDYFATEFYARNYELFCHQRTGSKHDSVVVLVNKAKFRVHGAKNLSLCSVRDRVALFLWLEHIPSKKHIVLSNTHLTFPHNPSESLKQLDQLEILLKEMKLFAEEKSIPKNCLQLVVGDFNDGLHSRLGLSLNNHSFLSCFQISPPTNPRETTTEEQQLEENYRDYSQNQLMKKAQEAAARKNPSSPSLFVSHRNHLQQDVGVDHIFIRQMGDEEEGEQQGGGMAEIDRTAWTAVGNSPNHNNNNHNNHNGGGNHSPLHLLQEQFHQNNNTTTTMKRSLSTQVAQVAPPLVPSSSSPASSDSVKEKEKEKVFVDSCFVIPRDRPCHQWPTDFGLSDHRPVTARILLAKRKTPDQK